VAGAWSPSGFDAVRPGFAEVALAAGFFDAAEREAGVFRAVRFGTFFREIFLRGAFFRVVFRAAFLRAVFLLEIFLRPVFLRAVFFRLGRRRATFFRAGFLRPVFFPTAFLRRTFFREPFFRVVFLRPAFLRAALGFRAAFLRDRGFFRVAMTTPSRCHLRSDSKSPSTNSRRPFELFSGPE
jgi:hypothetical protein